MSNGEFTIKNWATFKNALNKFIKELTYGVSAPRESAAKVNNCGRESCAKAILKGWPLDQLFLNTAELGFKQENWGFN